MCVCESHNLSTHSLQICHTKRVERSTDRNLPPIFTKLATKVRVPGDVVIYCFWWKSETFLSVKAEVELILITAPMENIFNVKYLENGERYDVGLKGGQIGNRHVLSIGTITVDLGRP